MCQLTLIIFYQINNADFEKDIVRNIHEFIKKANLLELLRISQRHFIVLIINSSCKINGYGFTLPALRLIHDYLPKTKQKAEIDDVVLGQKYYLAFHRGSILAPLFFNIFLADLFFVVIDIDIASYTNDSTSFYSGK